jgi:curved DNA-binding protein
MAEDLYGVLGVPRGSDAETIKKAYRKLAKDLHPDRNPGNAQAEARFKSVNHAFDVLSDPKRRRLYDEFGEEGLREGFDPDRMRQYRTWAAQQGAGAAGGGFQGTVNLEDLFGQAAAGGAGGAGTFNDLFGDVFAGRGRARWRAPQKGPDFESEVTIDFASAVRGTTLELRPQGAAGQPVTVRIPPGANEGSRVRIAGQGAPSPSGGPPGDLVLTIHVEPHEAFRREGDDLHVDVPVTLAEAFHGAKVKVPTIDGFATVKVPERTQSGTVLRLRGKGVVRKGKVPGDLYLHFQVKIPTAASAEVAELIDKLAAYQTEDVREKLRL